MAGLRTQREVPARPSAEDRVDPVGPSDLQRHSLLSFFELSKELDFSLDVYDVADVGLLNLMGHLGTSSAALWMMTLDGCEPPVLLRSQGLGAAVAKSIGRKCIPTLAGRFGEKHEVLFQSDFSGILDSSQVRLIRDSRLSLFACLPTHGTSMAVVALGERVGGQPYEPFELEVLQASIDLLAVALDNAVLYQKLHENNRNLRQTKERLEELDRLKTEFLNGMHHEIRTPLAVMHTYLESLLEETPAGTDQHEHLGIVLRQASKLKKMLLDLLDLSKIGGQGLETTISTGDVTATIRDFHAKRRHGVALKLHEFHIRVASDVPEAFYDPRRLEQILDALVDNAVKFTPQGTNILIRVRKHQEDGATWVRVDLEDDGPGIPKDRLASLFDAFRQGDGSLTREAGGMGVGLALGRQLAEAMRGRLDVQSEVGKGTIFTILLPTAPPV